MVTNALIIFLATFGIILTASNVDSERVIENNLLNETTLIKAAIVTTVRQPGIEFDSWLCYHLGIGKFFSLSYRISNLI